MMENWLPFWIFLGVVFLLSTIAAIFAKPIKKMFKELDFYSDGKKTDHHSYMPYQ